MPRGPSAFLNLFLFTSIPILNINPSFTLNVTRNYPLTNAEKTRTRTLGALPRTRAFPALIPQEIVQANEEIRLGADLASKYRKNAQFNIEALRANGALPSDSTDDASGILGGRGGRTPTVDDPQP